jgi:membrane-associated phospholipid phosphatase
MNNQIFFLFYNLAHQSVFGDKLIVFFAQTFPYLVILLAAIFLFFHHEIFSAEKPFKALRQKWREIVLVFFSGALAWCLAQVLKFLVHTPRPFEALSNVHNLINETGYSFPSGHATFFMALALAIFFSHKKAGYRFMFFALLIGLARIIAGIHFPVDILGGFVLGAGVAYFVRFSYQKLKNKNIAF